MIRTTGTAKSMSNVLTSTKYILFLSGFPVIPGIIHLLRTQIFRKTNISYPLTRTLCKFRSVENLLQEMYPGFNLLPQKKLGAEYTNKLTEKGLFRRCCFTNFGNFFQYTRETCGNSCFWIELYFSLSNKQETIIIVESNE